jgi:mono/diheme cytochrome c family protein
MQAMTKRHSIGLVALAATCLLATATLADPGFAQDRPGPSGGDAAVADSGKEIFEQICQACHMADAKGGGDSGMRVPALADNPHLANKDYPIAILLKGRGGMPWFTDILTKPQIAAVITYVRGHFNTYKDPVSVADIDRVGSSKAPVPDCNCGH